MKPKPAAEVKRALDLLTEALSVLEASDPVRCKPQINGIRSAISAICWAHEVAENPALAAAGDRFEKLIERFRQAHRDFVTRN